MTDQQVLRYLELVNRLLWINLHSGVGWRSEYGPELEAVRAELAELKPLVEMERCYPAFYLHSDHVIFSGIKSGMT